MEGSRESGCGGRDTCVEDEACCDNMWQVVLKGRSTWGVADMSWRIGAYSGGHRVALLKRP